MTRTLAGVLFVWAGLLAGVSFIATPAKFLAPSLPMAQAVDVGRWTFHVLSWVEAGLVAVTSVLIFIAWRSGTARIGVVAGLIAIVAVVLAVESFGLRPLLDARVLRIMAGESVPPSQSHSFYIVLEALRLALILAAGIVASRLIGGRNA
jgi:hypothetical protein